MTSPSPQKASTRAWSGLALLVAPMLTLSTDLTALFFAMPTLVADLDASATESLWIVHAYGFLIVGLLITMGRVSDRVGARRLLLCGASVFAVLSVVAAFADTPGALIAARALLGAAGATLMPSLYSLLRVMFRNEGQRRLAIAIMFSAFTIGGAIGPLLGGVLLDAFWWGTIFLVNVPPMLVLVALGRFVLPERHEPTASRIDVASVGLSIVGMLVLVYGLQEIAAGSGGEAEALPPWVAVALIAAGLGLLAAFVRRQRRLADPLFDFALLRNRRFAVSLLTLLVTGVGTVGLFFLFTQHLQWVGGCTPVVAGLLTLPYIAMDILGALVAPAMARRWPSSRVVTCGLGTLTLGAGLTALAVADGTVVFLVVAVSVMGVGHGAALVLISDALISIAPEERVGSAAAAQEVGGELGTALGVAAGGTVGIAVFRRSLERPSPGGTPAEAVEAMRSSIHEGFTIAHSRTDGSATLVEIVRDAMSSGLLVYALVAAALVGSAACVFAVVHAERPPSRRTTG
ncbi:MFS transporter [Microbacterium karelineae]|uniref:MFS transporter n=1 Tax=Microbacterium karelineae TaxID=2654283 RepID=UPI0018D3061C|nr:MFS transporter [Microbacterium karelineae]